ncbi:camp-specific phosphodiesterase, putative [Leishmania tarentolae]|uniref:Camp-specific phosphodiesterase, putative n=1 Tax=Leishmania tarentolae TaxID=5689 RepID=A0A640K7H1_LEITA|nr:camp-specific phosphodiesterase, putative [Leishmania tarentolae]
MTARGRGCRMFCPFASPESFFVWVIAFSSLTVLTPFLGVHKHAFHHHLDCELRSWPSSLKEKERLRPSLPSHHKCVLAGVASQFSYICSREKKVVRLIIGDVFIVRRPIRLATLKSTSTVEAHLFALLYCMCSCVIPSVSLHFFCSAYILVLGHTTRASFSLRRHRFRLISSVYFLYTFNSLAPMLQLPPMRSAPKQSSMPPSADAKMNALDVLVSVRDDPSLSPQLREKIGDALAQLRETCRKADKASVKKAPPRSCAHNYFEEMISGRAPLRFSCYSSESTHTRAKHFDIASSRLPGPFVMSSSKTFIGRTAPALQNPKEVFGELNAISFQTLRYIDEVEQIEFDVTNVREHDGSIMEDKERLFLSVCCSVFANFSFFRSLCINAEKFFHFLRKLFTCYPVDNAYHNATHAADALQMMSLFFREPSVNFLFSDEEIAICFLSVLAVDVAHPGASDALLVALDHPLAAVFGDVAIAEHASLLVFTSMLVLEDNFFFPTPDEAVSVDSAHLVKETLYDVVLNATLRNRPSLLSALRDIETSGRITDADAPKLMAALLVMACNSFAFRSQAQCCLMGAWFLSELHREECEMERHGIRVTLPHVAGADCGAVLSDYINVVVKPVTAAIRALVPTDLKDRLEWNADLVNAAASTGGRACKVVVESSLSPWITSSLSVMEILKKVATHANSVDRKASKCAILNASPLRSQGPVRGMMRTDSFSSNSSMSGSMRAAKREEETINCPQLSLTPQLCSVAGSPTARPGRSEHYFSFLRLYDKCERAGESAKDFVGQLIFLALQLDLHYIAAYARKKYGDDCCGAECAEMGLLINKMEEAPSTAEVIASRPPGGSFSSRVADESDHTDGFILFLMDMYCSREAALAEMESVVPVTDNVKTPPPAEPIAPKATPQYQQKSPIRMPVNTESKNTGSRVRLVP